jgi:long-chain acyl-CoA synthetase
MVALEDRFQTTVDEAAFGQAARVADLESLVRRPPAAPDAGRRRTRSSSRRGTAAPRSRLLRRASLATWILPLARVFAHVRVEGLEHLARLEGPVVFAANHQSHMDTPGILAAMPGSCARGWRWRWPRSSSRPHFFPDQHTVAGARHQRPELLPGGDFFNAFPLPQREAGARHTLRYIGELLGAGYSVLIYPGGQAHRAGEIAPFRPGIGMIGARLDVPVVPVRLEGVDRVLHQKAKMATPGPVRVAFGRAAAAPGR